MGSDVHSGGPYYDRNFLLSAQKRNAVLELWEIEKFGRDSFGDPDAVSLYGMKPAEWHARDIRILARTAVEAARDPLAKQIGAAVAEAVADGPSDATFVVDPFAGSCNTLFWVLRHLSDAEGQGFELDPNVFDLTSHNLDLIGETIRLAHGDYRSLLKQHQFSGRRVVALLAPPWADALDPKFGLDLSRTRPPIGEILDDFERAYSDRPVLYVVEVHERLAPLPLAQLRDAFDGSALKVFDIGGPTGRHGVLLGRKRWS